MPLERTPPASGRCGGRRSADTRSPPARRPCRRHHPRVRVPHRSATERRGAAAIRPAARPVEYGSARCRRTRPAAARGLRSPGPARRRRRRQIPPASARSPAQSGGHRTAGAGPDARSTAQLAPTPPPGRCRARTPAPTAIAATSTTPRRWRPARAETWRRKCRWDARDAAAGPVADRVWVCARAAPPRTICGSDDQAVLDHPELGTLTDSTDSCHRLAAIVPPAGDAATGHAARWSPSPGRRPPGPYTIVSRVPTMESREASPSYGSGSCMDLPGNPGPA